MSHIPHLKTLSPSKINTFFNEGVFAYLKLDGSFISVKLDEQGYYVQRKDNERYRSPSEWPTMQWARDFRKAHMAIDALFKVATPRELNIEMMFNEQPNTIQYRSERGFYIHSGDIIGLPSTVSVRYDETNYDEDGNSYVSHTVDVINIIDFTAATDLKMETFRSRYRDIADSTFTFNNAEYRMEDALAIDLTAYSKEERPLMKEVRAKAKELFGPLMDLLTDSIMAHFKDANEGIILKGEHTAKITYSKFPQMNRIAHIFRYALLGGTYPRRPSFLTKYQERSREANMKRLGLIQRRYNRMRNKLFLDTDFGRYYPYISEASHQRVINLFGELKDTIDGR